jgi:hypothetical protein
MFRILVRALCFALSGGIAGAAAGALMGHAVGLLCGGPGHSLAGEILFGAGLGTVIGALLSDPFGGDPRSPG